MEKSRFGVRLNSEKMEDGSAVSRSTRKPVTRTGITRTKAFLMVSNASYPDVHSMAFSRSIVLLLLIIYEYHVISVQVTF